MKSPIHHWHSHLNMKKFDEAWHQRDMADELAEYYEASGLIDKWSELSDVAYTYTRAQWSGYDSLVFPFSKTALFVGILYMIPKYTLRWRFFRALAKKLNPDLNISEVRNPQKIHKLETIAKRYNLDPEAFTDEAKKLLKGRFLLK